MLLRFSLALALLFASSSAYAGHYYHSCQRGYDNYSAYRYGSIGPGFYCPWSPLATNWITPSDDPVYVDDDGVIRNFEPGEPW